MSTATRLVTIVATGSRRRGDGRASIAHDAASPIDTALRLNTMRTMIVAENRIQGEMRRDERAECLRDG